MYRSALILHCFSSKFRVFQRREFKVNSSYIFGTVKLMVDPYSKILNLDRHIVQ